MPIDEIIENEYDELLSRVIGVVNENIEDVEKIIDLFEDVSWISLA